MLKNYFFSKLLVSPSINMSSIVSSQDLGATVEEQQNVSDEYYESNDEDMGSLAGTLEENKKTLETTATATQVKLKASKKSNSGVKSKKRKMLMKKMALLMEAAHLPRNLMMMERGHWVSPLDVILLNRN